MQLETGTLEHWRIVKSDRGYQISGVIKGDTKDRFDDGAIIRTSLVTSPEDPEDCERLGHVITRNSVYKLGKKAF